MSRKAGQARAGKPNHHFVKVGKDKTVSLADKEAAVTGYLAQLPALLNAVRALIGKPAPSAAARPLALTDAPAAIAGLKPVTNDWSTRPSTLQTSSFRSPDHGDQPITSSSSEVSRGQ